MIKKLWDRQFQKYFQPVCHHQSCSWSHWNHIFFPQHCHAAIFCDWIVVWLRRCTDFSLSLLVSKSSFVIWILMFFFFLTLVELTYICITSPRLCMCVCIPVVTFFKKQAPQSHAESVFAPAVLQSFHSQTSESLISWQTFSESCRCLQSSLIAATVFESFYEALTVCHPQTHLSSIKSIK